MSTWQTQLFKKCGSRITVSTQRAQWSSLLRKLVQIAEDGTVNARVHSPFIFKGHTTELFLHIRSSSTFLYMLPSAIEKVLKLNIFLSPLITSL